MKTIEAKWAAEMRLARFALKTNGLSVTDMHLRVLSVMEQADKYAVLAMVDDMVDDLSRHGVRALGQNVQNLSKRQAMLLLRDLRRWLVTNYCNDVVENCDRLCEAWRRVAQLEAENATMRAKLNDGWTQRVTYDATVEQIAACEDPRERDDARKLIEPMLKRDMARKFRDDIRRKVQELQGDKGATTHNLYMNHPVIEGDIVLRSEINIDKNYGPNIEQNGGTLSLPAIHLDESN